SSCVSTTIASAWTAAGLGGAGLAVAAGAVAGAAGAAAAGDGAAVGGAPTAGGAAPPPPTTEYESAQRRSTGRNMVLRPLTPPRAGGESRWNGGRRAGYESRRGSSEPRRESLLDVLHLGRAGLRLRQQELLPARVTLEKHLLECERVRS